MEERAASVAAWSGSADAWDELAAEVDGQLAPATEWMLDAVALRPGERVLEVAAGPGTLAARLARLVGSGGRVIWSDFSEAMLEVARRRLADTDGVELRLLDAQALDLPEASVAAVLCRCGYMLVPDPAAAFREAARVLAPGGRLALTAWGEGEANPWAALPMRAVARAVGAPPPPPGGPGLWALADEERLRRLLAGAGFAEVRVEHLDGVVEYPSVAAWLDRTSRLAGPLRALLASAGDEAHAVAAAELEAAAGPYATDVGGVVLPQRFVVASAVRTGPRVV